MGVFSFLLKAIKDADPQVAETLDSIKNTGVQGVAADGANLVSNAIGSVAKAIETLPPL